MAERGIAQNADVCSDLCMPVFKATTIANVLSPTIRLLDLKQCPLSLFSKTGAVERRRRPGATARRQSDRPAAQPRQPPEPVRHLSLPIFNANYQTPRTDCKERQDAFLDLKQWSYFYCRRCLFAAFLLWSRQAQPERLGACVPAGFPRLPKQRGSAPPAHLQVRAPIHGSSEH